MTNADGQLATTRSSLRLLEMIAESEGGTLTELTERTGHSKSTVYKHLQTLAANGYLVKRGAEYHLGLKFLAMGKRSVDSRGRYRIVEGKVRELASRTGVEVDFTVEEGGRLILVSEAVGQTNETNFEPGSRFHLHSTAAGKAILAAYPESRVRELLDEQGLPKVTERTVESKAALFDELETVRERGFAVNNGEAVEGYRTVGSVIRNPDDSVLGALSIGGPTYRIPQSRLVDELSTWVVTAADEITESLRTRQ